MIYSISFQAIIVRLKKIATITNLIWKIIFNFHRTWFLLLSVSFSLPTFANINVSDLTQKLPEGS